MPKLQYSQNVNRYHITVPAQVARLKGWKAGIELFFVACEDGSIKLKEITTK